MRWIWLLLLIALMAVGSVALANYCDNANIAATGTTTVLTAVAQQDIGTQEAMYIPNDSMAVTVRRSDIDSAARGYDEPTDGVPSVTAYTENQQVAFRRPCRRHPIIKPRCTGKCPV